MEPRLRKNPSPSAGATLLGKYRLGRLLGRGSFAKVHQAQSLADNSTVAVKIIDKSKTSTAMERCIVQEIAAMRRLDSHPNILKIIEVLATKTKIYLVVEFAAGGELFGKISRRRGLPEPAARRLFQQLASALTFCHENGVAHRDVKPQNLLLDENGDLKLSDFGLSALPEQLRNGLLHTACGTPAYSAPEVMARRGGYDGARADAWSCGVILFVLLSGYLPFNDSNLAAMYKKIHLRDYQFPAWVSKPARHLINRLLDPDPNTRMSMEALALHPWFRKSLRSTELQPVTGRKSEAGPGPGPVMNAFDIISMSSGLDLSGLFETGEKRRERRLTAEVTAEEVETAMRKVGEEMGKKRMGLAVEVLVVAPRLVMVEVTAVKGEVEFEDRHWRSLEEKLGMLVVPWQSQNNP